MLIQITDTVALVPVKDAVVEFIIVEGAVVDVKKRGDAHAITESIVRAGAVVDIKKRGEEAVNERIIDEGGILIWTRSHAITEDNISKGNVV